MPLRPSGGSRSSGAAAVVGGGALLLVLAPMLSAQQPESSASAGTEFDLSRAFVADRTIFEPFYVTEARPLREVVDEGVIHDGTRLLILEREGERLALLTEQMAYHHVAQGELKGEPWLVSF